MQKTTQKEWNVQKACTIDELEEYKQSTANTMTCADGEEEMATIRGDELVRDGVGGGDFPNEDDTTADTMTCADGEEEESPHSPSSSSRSGSNARVRDALSSPSPTTKMSTLKAFAVSIRLNDEWARIAALARSTGT